MSSATATRSQDIPKYSLDIFSHESVRNARGVDDRMREFAPVVRLEDGTVMLTRYADVATGLKDWGTFSNTSRPWHDPASVRPEILLTDDPPRHTEARGVMAEVLSPAMLEAERLKFERYAAEVVDEALAREGEVIDVVNDITQKFVYRVLPDLVGIPVEGREHMSAFGHMVWATMGPPNALFAEAMQNLEPVLAWIDWSCNRENLAPDSVGEHLYRLADEGRVTHDEAKLLVQTILAAGADTTVLTMANAMGAFSLFPDEYRKVRETPRLVRNAFDESLRWDSPSRMAGRITTRDVEIEDYLIPAGTRVGLMFAAANRDPRTWEDPDRFDVNRDVRKSVGWGYGVHACVGRTLAQLEAMVLLAEVARRIESFEPAGEPEPWMTTVGHGPVHLPVRIFAA